MGKRPPPADDVVEKTVSFWFGKGGLIKEKQLCISYGYILLYTFVGRSTLVLSEALIRQVALIRRINASYSPENSENLYQLIGLNSYHICGSVDKVVLRSEEGGISLSNI